MSDAIWLNDCVTWKSTSGLQNGNNQMKTIFSKLTDYFTRHDWKFTVDEKSRILIDFYGKNGQWRCVVIPDEEEHLIIFLSLLPCLARENLQPACVELMSRINWRLTAGCFALDFSDGEILFKTTAFLQRKKLSDEFIGGFVGYNLSTMDRHFPAFMKVLYTGAKPIDALANPEEHLLIAPQRFELN